MGKDALSTRHVGAHPAVIAVDNEQYGKVQDLRYGTNPPQTAALYNGASFLGSLREVRTGKEGPSQTNMEDILYAALTVGYFNRPTAAIMKHENPSGLATQYEQEPLALTFRKAFDADFRAAFGGTVFVNAQVDAETADAMTENFAEVVVAPGYDEGVLEKFKGSTRVFLYDQGDFKSIPRYTGDPAEAELKRLPDGSVIRSDVFLSPISGVDDLKQYVASMRQPTEEEFRDALTGYRISLRSNSVRFVKDGYTVALGTGQQDRVGCMEIAAYRNGRLQELAQHERRKRAADYTMPGSVLVSDGFFPFTDSIKLARDLGVTAVLAPHGGQKFREVLSTANDFNIAFIDLPAEMRFFAHR